MAQPDAYLTDTEATTLLSAEVLSTDPQLMSWNALSMADKIVALRLATEQIDAVTWTGARKTITQQLAWPRVDLVTGAIIDKDPDESDTISVKDLPRVLTRACVMQAATIALRFIGLDPTAHVEFAAARGVASHSGGGQSENIDLARATNAWSKLAPRAQSLLARYRFRGGPIK